MQQAIFYICVTMLAARLLIATATVVGSSWYDVRRLQQRKKRGPKALISVVIVADNHESSIGQCLESILTDAYKKCEIIVVDNDSRDRTKATVKKIMREYPYAPVKLLAKRKRSSFEAAASAGIAAHANGSLLLVIDGDSLIDGDAFEKAAAHFSTKNRTQSVELNQRVLPSPSLFGLLQQFDALSRFYTRKLTSLFNNSNGRVAYESRAIIRLQPATTFASLRVRLQPPHIARLCFSLLDFFAVVYFLYVAYSLGDALLLTTALLALVVYFCFAIWTAERMAMADKLRFSLFIPSAGVLFLLQSAVKWTNLLPSVKKLTELPLPFVYSNKR